MESTGKKEIECRWSTNMDTDFLESQKYLTIFLKDGYSFFKANAELLTRRFADPNKTTKILIVHPDSPYIDAVAAMDDRKKGHPESQRSDCLQAVQFAQNVRAALNSIGKDCIDRVAIKGHDSVPTWNGFIGDDTAIVNLYPTRPYRGPLPTLTAKKGDDMYQWAIDDCVALTADAKDLWSYSLPAGLPDLRR